MQKNLKKERPFFSGSKFQSFYRRIFKNPMTTMAAIDCLVHHATILEFTGESIRANAAKKRQS